MRSVHILIYAVGSARCETKMFPFVSFSLKKKNRSWQLSKDIHLEDIHFTKPLASSFCNRTSVLKPMFHGSISSVIFFFALRVLIFGRKGWLFQSICLWKKYCLFFFFMVCLNNLHISHTMSCVPEGHIILSYMIWIMKTQYLTVLETWRHWNQTKSMVSVRNQYWWPTRCHRLFLKHVE